MRKQVAELICTVSGCRLLLAVALLAAGIAACTTSGRADLAGMSFASGPLAGKVVWRDLITEDLDSARRFYGGLFDWTFEDSQGPDGQEYAIALSGNVYVAGMVAIASPADGTRYSRWLPYVSVTDVDDAVSEAVAGGASVAASARNVNIGRIAIIVDPEGAVIGLARSKFGDPDDRTTAPAPGRPVWTELLSNDTVAAAKFYRALGDYDVSTVDRRGGEYTLLTNNGESRAGILKNPADNLDPVWLTYFGVDDPAAAASRAESLGGSIILPASQELREGTMAVVSDPSGAILVLQKWSISGGTS
ncbi:MAG: VOC family protein [Woeseiaceae bacterium]|nr:VOC family protein [Woeseiaceae bacterium]